MLDRHNQRQDKGLATAVPSRWGCQAAAKTTGCLTTRGEHLTRGACSPPVFPSLFPCQAFTPCRPGERDESTAGAFHGAQPPFFSLDGVWESSRHGDVDGARAIHVQRSSQGSKPGCRRWRRARRIHFSSPVGDASALASQNHRSPFAVTESSARQARAEGVLVQVSQVLCRPVGVCLQPLRRQLPPVPQTPCSLRSSSCCLPLVVRLSEVASTWRL